MSTASRRFYTRPVSPCLNVYEISRFGYVTLRDSFHVPALAHGRNPWNSQATRTAYQWHPTRARIKDNILAAQAQRRDPETLNATGWLRLRAGPGERILQMCYQHASDRAATQ